MRINKMSPIKIVIVCLHRGGKQARDGGNKKPVTTGGKGRVCTVRYATREVRVRRAGLRQRLLTRWGRLASRKASSTRA